MGACETVRSTASCGGRKGELSPSTGAEGAQSWGLGACFSSASAKTNLTLIKALPSGSVSHPGIRGKGEHKCPLLKLSPRVLEEPKANLSGSYPESINLLTY